MMIAKVYGVFEKISGKLIFDRESLGLASAEATIEAASINTREPQRDGHLKSPDFFDVEKFPTLSFKSKQVTVSGKGELLVIGELTIKDVTKQITLEIDGPSDEIKDPYGNLKIGISGTTKIKRKDFGLTWNAALETGGVLVGDEVTITLDLQFAKQ
jgi:polyisoprenoid-binding protein YceI